MNLCNFLTTSICSIGQDRLTEGKELVIGGGHQDGEKAVRISRGHCGDVVELRSNHEEADTRMLLHARHAANATTRVVIQSPDTDVLALSVCHFTSIGSQELWFRTGVKDKLRFIPVHAISQVLGERMCKALPAFHALTGCDSTSALSGIGKKRAWVALNRSVIHQESLCRLGEQQQIDETIAAKCEAFICALYPLSRKTAHTSDELHYLLFCQKKQKSEMLPPTSDSLLQHMKRANYQCFVWRHSLDAVQDIQPSEGHGWVRDGEVLNPLLMTKAPAPECLLELTTCQCEKSECQRNCSCRNSELACTEACLCMAEENVCKNPHGIPCTADSDSEESDLE